MKKKILIIITIALLAILVGGFLMWKKQTPQLVQQEVKIEEPKIQEVAQEIELGDIDTSNWKTYRNEEYGFEFKYPEGWYITNDVEFKNNPNYNREIIHFSNYPGGYDKSNAPIDLLVYGVTVYKNNDREYNRLLNYVQKLAANQYKFSIDVDDKNQIKVFIIYKDDSSMEDLDIIKPVADGFMKNGLYYYNFSHMTEWNLQQESMDYLIAAMKTFKLALDHQTN